MIRPTGTAAAIAGDDNPLIELLDRELERELAALVPPGYWERALIGPAREFLRRPGKEFRARLVEAAWMLGGGVPGAMPATLPLVVEVLHAGSLIIDDIEDDSAERRGAPTLHRVVGTPLALNTGNWMYFWSVALLRRSAPESLVPSLIGKTLDTMLHCHEGQALDLSVRIFDLPQGDVGPLVAATTDLKTGGLMELAAFLGGTVAGADSDRCAALARFGRALGNGLQRLDDLGGVTSARRRDKGHEDLRHARPTWPWAWLADELDEVTFHDLRNHAREVAGGADPAPLSRRIGELVRPTGHADTHHHLTSSLAELRAAIGAHPALDAIEGEINRLERSYE
jgi:geranylgeranyl pyrophosphate synthase